MNEMNNRELQVAMNKVCSGEFDFTEKHLATVFEYFKTQKPELYKWVNSNHRLS